MPPKRKRAATASSSFTSKVAAAKKKTTSHQQSTPRNIGNSQTTRKVSAKKSVASGGKRPPSTTALSSALAATTAKRKDIRAGHKDASRNTKSKSRTATARRKEASKRSRTTPTATGEVSPPSPLPVPQEPPKQAERLEKVAVTATTAKPITVNTLKENVSAAVGSTGTANNSNATTAKAEVNRQAVETAEAAAALADGASSSYLRRYLPHASSSFFGKPWNASDAVVFSTFLAQVEFSFVRRCCQLLAKLTTATSPAFLHVAALGEAALASAAKAENCVPFIGSSSCKLVEVEQLVDRQEEAYRTIRATIAASCTLGHRSCQVLWGPRGSGKHRILRLLAQEVRRTPNTFVMELHGQLLRDDEAALGVIAQQLFAFLQSPQAQQLCASHDLLRTGSFGFGQLFRFPQRMQEESVAAPAAALMREEKGEANNGSTARRRGGAESSKQLRPSAAQLRGQSGVASSASDSGSTEVDDKEEEEAGNADMMVTSTTTYLTGGAASALPHLQRALLLLKNQGCSIVACIRDIDVFGIRCDQLLYVLSGLMHDSEGSNGGGGGGLSLVLASAAPDIRQLEKRLSSRLTCETRFVPLLPWSLNGLLAATVHVAAQDALFHLRVQELSRERTELLTALREGATRLRRGQESAPLRGAAKKAEEKAMKELQELMADLEGRLLAAESNLREVRIQRRHFLGFLDTDATLSSTTANAVNKKSFSESGAASSGWRTGPPIACATQIASQHSTVPSSFVVPRSWTVKSLHAHPSLPLEVQCVLCEELLRQLRLAVIAAADTGFGKRENLTDGNSLAALSLAQRVVSLGVALALESSTSATVLTALTSVLCKAASGEVDLMGTHGRCVLLQWIRARLQNESIPLPVGEDANGGGGAKTNISACPPGLPVKILTRWRESAQALAPPVTTSTTPGDAVSGGALKPPFSLFTGSSSPLGNVEGSSSESGAIDTNMESMHYRRNKCLLLPPLSLLPPQLFDLFAEGQLVGMGYGSREMMLVLFYMHLHNNTGVRQRTVADLLEDVSSSLGTRAAAALDREAFRHVIRLLCQWRLLTVVESHAQVVQLCGSDARLREFLATLLSKQPAWCEAELGLDAREILHFRNLV